MTTSTEPAPTFSGLPEEVTRLVARARANALATCCGAARPAVRASLERDGIAPGMRVALLSRNCWEFAALAWGCARLGAVLVPVNFMLTADEVAYLLADAEVSALFAGSDLAATAAAALASSGAPARLRVVIRGESGDGPSFADWLEPAPAGWAAPPVDDDAVI